MLLDRIAGLVMPISSKYIIDEVIGKGRGDLLAPIALAAMAAILLQSITSFFLSLTLGVTTQRLVIEIRKKVQAHVGRLPICYFDSTQSGKLIARIMHDAEGVRVLVGGGLIQLCGSVISAMISIGILFYLNWWITTFILIVIVAFAGCQFFGFKKLRPLFRESAELYSLVTGRLGQALSGIRIIKVFTAEKREEQIFTRDMQRIFRNFKSSLTINSLIAAFSIAIVGSIGMAVIAAGGYSVLLDRMTLGDLFMYVLFAGLMASPLIEIAVIGPQIAEAFAGLDRLREILNTPAEDEEDASKSAIDEIEGEVEFENVWFEYVAGIPVLRNISFKAPAGSTVALVGASGSGKSTLTSLVMNFNRPCRGHVKIDGRDLSTLKIRDYRSYLGAVLQDNFLFDGTLAENISYSRPDASHDEIKAASRIAHCEEFIESFDEKYETVVGERGVKLSGGQRQRVAIARAMLADPKILILDEATSNLDSECEALIQESLRSLRRGRTTFVIAHRLSTIHNADLIMVLKNGEIVERGTHKALLATSKYYKQLYDKQANLQCDQYINSVETGLCELSDISR